MHNPVLNLPVLNQHEQQEFRHGRATALQKNPAAKTLFDESAVPMEGASKHYLIGYSWQIDRSDRVEAALAVL